MKSPGKVKINTYDNQDRKRYAQKEYDVEDKTIIETWSKLHQFFIFAACVINVQMILASRLTIHSDSQVK